MLLESRASVEVQNRLSQLLSSSSRFCNRNQAVRAPEKADQCSSARRKCGRRCVKRTVIARTTIRGGEDGSLEKPRNRQRDVDDNGQRQCESQANPLPSFAPCHRIDIATTSKSPRKRAVKSQWVPDQICSSAEACAEMMERVRLQGTASAIHKKKKGREKDCGEVCDTSSLSLVQNN